MADVRTIGFVKVIQDELFAGNDFIKLSTSHDEFVNDKTVEVPQAGTVPAVQKNRSVLPATVSQRTDDKLTYNLDEYSTDPMVITNKDMAELSYSKRASIMKQHMDKLNEEIALATAYAWGGAGLVTAGGQIVLTSGTATANIAPPTGTGNRKSIALADIGKLAQKLDIDSVSGKGRYLLMPVTMYWDMLRENPTLSSRDYMPDIEASTKFGAVKMIYGFNIITRPEVTVYANTNVKKAPGAAAATNDNFGAIAWGMDYVARALGAIKPFYETDKPEYYGDVMSFLVRYAATQLRNDGKGVATLVQGV